MPLMVENKMAEKKKHGFKKIHMEHHKDGSVTLHHEHEMPEHDVKHAVSNLDQAHDSIEDHIGEPNEGESEADQGMHGIPAEHAGPAGLPMQPEPGE